MQKKTWVKKNYKILLVGIFFILLILLEIIFFWFSYHPVLQDPPQLIVEDTIATTTTTISGYTVELVHSSNSMDTWSKILILKNEDIVFENDTRDFLPEESEGFSGFYTSGSDGWITNADELKSKAFKDVTGDGIPELVLSLHSGTSFCCSLNYIISLSYPLYAYLILFTGNSGIEFKDLNNDGIMEIVTYEDAFTYWHTSYAVYPTPRVVLSLQDNVYKLDPVYMRQPAPSDAKIRVKASEVKSWSGASMSDVAWKYAVDLIYSGNMASAKKYVDLAWSKNDLTEFKTKEVFWKELIKQIQDESPYYTDLKTYFGI